MASDTSSPAAAIRSVVEAAAAVLADPTSAPMSFNSPAAAAINSCAANTYDIGEPPNGPCLRHGSCGATGAVRAMLCNDGNCNHKTPERDDLKSRLFPPTTPEFKGSVKPPGIHFQIN